MHVARRRLVVPRHLAGVDVHRDERAGEQPHAFAATGRRIRGRRIACAEDVVPRLGIEDAGHPDLSAAMACRIEARPRLDAGIARVHRHGVEDPLALAGFRVVRLEKAGHVEVVARAHQDVVVDDDRRHRGKILLVEARDLDAPLFLSRSRVELYEVVVVELGEDEVPPHADAAMARVRSAAGLPVVLPENRAVACVHGPDVVRRGWVQDAVDHQNRSADGGRTAGVEFTGP